MNKKRISSGGWPARHLISHLSYLIPLFLLLPLAARAGKASLPTYTVVGTDLPGCVNDTTNTETEVNWWMNSVYVGSSGVLTNRAVTAADPDNPVQGKFSLVASEVGYYWDRSKPDYYLSDVVDPPDDIDWQATTAAYDELIASGGESGFLLNPDRENPCVYAVSGGTKKFNWILKDGSTNETSYTVAATCKDRPRRIYWTDSPYNGPAISLEGKFVRIIDNNGICAVARGTVTNDVGGVQTISEDTVIEGVYIDESSQVMYAKGQRRGQFVLVFYDTGSYENILCLEVIEICEPVATVCKGVVGQKLEASGCGYDVDGLVPQVSAGIGDADDDYGDYLYQHTGDESYSPKNKWVFPIRPSVGKRWKQEIYWMETDPMGVQWPFELDQYESDWPEHGSIFVRGDVDGDTGAKVYIPSEYTAELQDYQEPLGHALQVTGDNVFETTGEGWSLLKLTADDNIWFLPIHSVNRSNTGYFTLAEHEITVGQELRVRGGSESGIAPGAAEFLTATDEAPGYVYLAASTNVYNADLYYETTAATDPNATQTSVGDTLPSKVFAVNEASDAIEVWWSRRVQEDGMPYWIDIPCLPQRYVPRWPDATEAPTIVIASEKGSACESLFQQYGAATFDRSNARMQLMSKDYFPNGEGMVSFWTRPSKCGGCPMAGVTNDATALLYLGNRDGRSLALRIGYEEELELVLDGETVVTNVPMPVLPRPNVWTHVALAITNNATSFALYTNAALAAEGKLADAGFLGKTLNRSVIGRVMELPGEVSMPEIDDGSAEPGTTGADDLLYSECNDFAELMQAFANGKNAKLKASVSNDPSRSEESNTIHIAKNANVTLDLNGKGLVFNSNNRLFDIEGTLTIRDGASKATSVISHGNSSAFIDGGKIARVLPLGKLVLAGGTLKGNGKSDICPLVSVDGKGTKPLNAVFQMTGGAIADGCSARYGGGVLVNNGTFQLEGGTIRNCHAESCGGGVAVQAGAYFTMTGGSIDGCSAGALGGGVYATGNVTLNGGRIINNTARIGGGVDASGSYANFLFQKGLIATNVVLRTNAAVSNDFCYGAGIALQKGSKCYMKGGFVVANEARGTEGAASLNVPACAAFGSESGSVFVMNAGGFFKNVSEAGTPPMGTQGGTIVLKGGILDFEPTTENVVADAGGVFDQPYYMSNDKLGIHRVALGTAIGRQISEVIFRSEVLQADSIEDARYRILTGSEQGVSGYYSFRPGEDLESVIQKAAGADYRFFFERTVNWRCFACNTVLETPGAPGYKPFIIDADATPTVYAQNYRAQAGYNPNEEHAFVNAGGGGYIAWALRADLNTASSSKPGVLVEYEKDGEAKMQFFHVVITNGLYRELAGTCTVAEQLPGPQPLTQMSDPWLPEDHWDSDPNHPDMPGIAYRDRKGQLWARRDGTLPIYMYYRLQEGFFIPQYGEDNQPATGTAVPWLARYANPEADPIKGEPAVWTWTARWPDEYAEMKIGQTLYTASDGLPGVYNMTSASVIYPSPHEESGSTETVALIDPTVEQSVAFDYKLLAELGLSTDPNGGLNLRKGKYYFNELPPNLSSRIWVDSSNNKLCLIGKYDKKNAGTSILYLNVLTSNEHIQVQNVVPESMRSGTAWTAWQNAVAELGKSRVEPNDMTAAAHELKTTYWPRDSYALAAVGNTNWVVLVENDAPTTNETRTVDGVETTVKMGVNAGDSINMHVFRVVPKYYVPKSYNGIVTKEDEQNLLSQRLSILYVEGFGGESDKYEFQWKSASTRADGTIPEDYDDEYQVRPSSYADATMPHITVGEQGDTLDNMVNKYWICRYRARSSECPAYAVMGQQWSEWAAPPALAEGWVQRVLNNVTPFNQLMTDLYENEAETAVSMIQKAGKAYSGDVALNQDALTECGLIELYETMFNKAESMSLLLGIQDSGANAQLLLCAERLGDLYTVLGDEAYSDAKNPTIGFGMSSASVDYGAASSALFCFDNQVSTLLDEELALLRGRTAESAPYVTKHLETGDRRVTSTGPYYNRLLWNFTKGITAGEVAYAVNYGVEGEETTALSEEQAARLYPQGHGDAYGHYLSALKGWYRLLRNPYFNWVCAQGEMNVGDSAVNVDYYEEAKFSEAALKVAKAAADVVDLTARKAYQTDGEKLAGYRDEDNERSFGYGEWANRGGYGAFVNWAVANSLLPADGTTYTTGTVNNVTALFADEALTRIDRGTVDELAELCTQASSIQAAEDRVDSGLNPLGLDDNAIPFDITPIGVDDGTKTHFEQIRERAGTAVENARIVLDHAQEYANRLAMLEDSTESLEDQIEEAELAYTQELINYYGTPYSDDIGPGKTYEQGYEGPDTVHYMWMDLSQFDLDDLGETTVTVYKWNDCDDITSFSDMIDYYEGEYEGRQPKCVTVELDFSAYGVVVKPSNITGTRTAQGSIQEKYSDFLTKYKEYDSAISSFEDEVEALDGKLDWYKTMLGRQEAKKILQEINSSYKFLKASNTYLSNRKTTKLDTAITYDNVEYVLDNTAADNLTIAGTANGINATAVANALEEVPKKLQVKSKVVADIAAKNSELLWTYIGETLNYAISVYDYAISVDETDTTYADKIRTHLSKISSAASSVQSKARELRVCVEAYKSEIAKAEQVLEQREANRKKWVNKLSQFRYNDMFFRRLRNQALSRYTASFDLAQKYVWEAAKVYGYETGMVDDDNSAATFMNQIIASRSLGSFDSDGFPIVGDVGDTGLAGILAQMDANWLVLKPRLGINNPQPYATWFSLRNECFRILSGAAGDGAWAKELTKYWTDDITANADFIRHCQPFQSQFGLKEREPGLIIPFETTIDFAKNLFGQDLAGEDSAYDSTWYATRIYSAGLWFDGYNAKAEGYAGKAQLANTPVAYLVPIGDDCLRAPGLEDGSYLRYSVVDQVIAAPYAIGSSYLNDQNWFPSASDGDLGGADATTRIRKHPSFRAYFDTTGGAPTDSALDCTRLVGRSVWNTKWILVIPAGGMNADRDKALSIFINGSDENRDGTLDLLPVSDIRIGFKTYSNSGN